MTRRQAIRRAIADFDALHGRGSAARDLALGLLASAAVLANLTALAAAFGGAS